MLEAHPAFGDSVVPAVHLTFVDTAAGKYYGNVEENIYRAQKNILCV